MLPPTAYVALGGRIDVQHRVFCHKAAAATADSAAESAQPLRMSSPLQFHRSQNWVYSLFTGLALTGDDEKE
jgi:hypothetical protein